MISSRFLTLWVQIGIQNTEDLRVNSGFEISFQAFNPRCINPPGLKLFAPSLIQLTSPRICCPQEGDAKTALESAERRESETWLTIRAPSLGGGTSLILRISIELATFGALCAGALGPLPPLMSTLPKIPYRPFFVQNILNN